MLCHRTFDPDEADFFYVPQYSTCYIYPIHNWADYPWFPVPGWGEQLSGSGQVAAAVFDGVVLGEQPLLPSTCLE